MAPKKNVGSSRKSRFKNALISTGTSVIGFSVGWLLSFDWVSKFGLLFHNVIFAYGAGLSGTAFIVLLISRLFGKKDGKRLF